MSRRQMLLTIATISAMAAMLVCYGMAWLARDLKSFTDHWAETTSVLGRVGQGFQSLFVDHANEKAIGGATGKSRMALPR